MPVETRISPEFGGLVRALMGDDTYGQGTIKTGISQAYLLAMGRGKVPTRAIVERFVAGYKLSSEDRSKLLVAAGYDQPSELVPAVEAALPPVSDISEEEKAELLDMVKGYSSARNETTRHYIAETVKKILEEEKKEEGD